MGEVEVGNSTSAWSQSFGNVGKATLIACLLVKARDAVFRDDDSDREDLEIRTVELSSCRIGP